MPARHSLSQPKPSSGWRLLLCLLVALPILLLADILLGSNILNPSELLGLFSPTQGNGFTRTIILEFRLPRAITAILAGSSLAVSGLLMQAVFRNPLADPFVLGVNSGASLGVAIILLAIGSSGGFLATQLNLSGNALVVASAILGSATILVIIALLAKRVDVTTLLILGLMISYGTSSIVSILMFFSMAEKLQSFFAWTYGSYATTTWLQLCVLGPVCLLAILGSFALSKQLNVLLLGENYASSVGVNARLIRYLALAFASVLAGAITGFCGPIGFIGIAAPHLCRSASKLSDHRILLPCTLLMGACIGLFSDIVSKVPGSSSVLPLNAVTALIGAPVIVLALLNNRNLGKSL